VLQYTIRRLVMLIPVLLGVSILTFLMVHVAPGDPVELMLPDYASAEDIARIRSRLGLDDPLYVQYLRYMANVMRLDFGRSIRTNRQVLTELLVRWPYTAQLAVAATALSVILGVPLGVLSAVKQNSWVDYSSMVLAILWVCLPRFFFAVMLQLIFSMHLGWFPVFGEGGAAAWSALSWWYVALPTISLGAQSAAYTARLSRSSSLDVLRQDYIRTARAKGLSERMVLYKHMLKNALIPVTTTLGLRIGGLLGGAFITETIFARPGVGRFAVQAVFQRDIPVIQAVALMMAVVFVFCNLLVDITYAFLNPRIRYN